MRFRHVCFTLNNYSEQEYEAVLALPHKYLIVGKEGAEATPHLQGYLELEKQLSLSTLKTMIPRAHLEKRRGTAQQAADYCKKEGDYVESGKLSQPGRRNDIHEMYAKVKEKKTDYEIQEAHPEAYARYYKALDRMRYNCAIQDNQYQPVEVLVFVGDAGTGKTKAAYEVDPGLYHQSIGESLWWDGYQGQETVLLDDFYGNIKYGLLLQLLDGYRFNLPIKGGFTWKQWKRVIITSNKDPKDWYRQGLTPALERRLSETRHFCSEVPDSITRQPLSNHSDPHGYHLEPLDF